MPTYDMKGYTGIAELGLGFAPSQTSNVYLDLGVQGFVGKRQGIMGNVQFTYTF